MQMIQTETEMAVTEGGETGKERVESGRKMRTGQATEDEKRKVLCQRVLSIQQQTKKKRCSPVCLHKTSL